MRELTLERALNLQKDLMAGFGSDDFQSKLKELATKKPQGTRGFNFDRQKLFLTVQSKVLPMYGFEGNQRGVFEMMEAFNQHSANTEFQTNGIILNHMLGLQVGPEEPVAPAIAAAEPEKQGKA